MNNMYMQNILDHYHDPENYGSIAGATVVQEEFNPFCGDKIIVYVLIEGEVIKDIKFEGEGCAISQAAMSMMSESFIGKPVEEGKKIAKDDVVEMLGIELSPTRLKCALLGLQAVHNALHKA